MVLVGLSAGELLALFSVLGGLITALYLLDRRRKKKVVSTFRFWTAASSIRSQRHPKRVREVGSLLLQLLALALLLLAIARLEWGNRRRGYDHVLLLDTSAWTAAMQDGRSVLSQEKQDAHEYVHHLPAGDRVMLVRVDSLFTPVTLFTQDRALLDRAIDESLATPRALHLNHAFLLASQARQASSHPGEIVYIGPGMISDQPEDVRAPSELRVVMPEAGRDNCGIRHILARRNEGDARIWRVSVMVKNYAAKPHIVRVRAAFAGNELGAQTLTLSPSQQEIAEFVFAAEAAGRFTATLEPEDSLMMDNRASVELPPRSSVRVAVFTRRPEILKPLFDGDPELSVAYYDPAQDPVQTAADLEVFDRCTPDLHPAAPALWIDPPSDHSPLPVMATADETEITHWESGMQPGLGLNEANLLVRRATVFQTFEGDQVVASAPAGPVVVARPAASGQPRSAVIGFDPFEKDLKFRLTTPLLVANLLHWLAPASFRASEVEGGRAASSSLAEVAENSWSAPSRAAVGLPPRSYGSDTVAFWKWLALLAGGVLLIEWIRYGRNKRARLRLVLKLASFAAIVCALAVPAIRTPRRRVAAVVLLDHSGSIGRNELGRAASIREQIAEHARGNWLRVMDFGSADATDLEAALMSGAASLPEGYVPRLILISDGNENEGSLERAEAELKMLRPSVDVIPLHGRAGSLLRLISVAIPEQAYSGEPIPISLQVESQERGRGVVQIWADGKPLGTHSVDLVRGENQIRLQAQVNSSGSIGISGRIASGGAEVSFARAVALRRASVLYISGDPPGSDQNLLGAFQTAGFQVLEASPEGLSSALKPAASGAAPFQLLVLNNVDLDAFSSEEKRQIEEYVKNGGGLLLIGGDHEIYHRHPTMDALDRVLPANLAPPKDAQGTAVALIIDKSSSMEGRKIELARMSAIGVVNHLRPTDTIGVLMFDNSYQWAVPMRQAGDKSDINRLIAGITPDGGTQIAPALNEAYRKVLAAKAAYKHIVLLTDGISEEGDSFELAQNAAANHVTISTVGLGQDVNRAYLEKIAAISGGHSYFLSQPQGLEQIVLGDVKRYTGSSAVEKSMQAVVERPAEILDGIRMESAPPLKGYSRFFAKPDAETILSIHDEAKDPLYVRWQYGLGRAAVFTSDAKSRWAQAWINWPGFDKFWINAARDLLKEPERREEISFDAGDGIITVRYHLPEQAQGLAAVPEIFALGPNGFKAPVKLEKLAPEVYQGSVYVGRATGLFRIRPVSDTGVFAETGIYLGEREANDFGTNVRGLSAISEATGGRYNPTPASIFDPGARFVSARLELWPGLLALSIVFTIAELVARKWADMRLRELFQPFNAAISPYTATS
jgi:Ca-activated chloride channel family protein